MVDASGDGQPTIRQLIEDRRRATGWSYQDLSHASGDVVSKKTFNDLATGAPKSWPTPTTIAGIARALNAPDDAIVLSIAVALGVPVRSHTSLLALQLPASADLLTPAERTYIVGIVKALTAGRVDTDAAEGAQADLLGEIGGLAAGISDQIDGGKK